VHHFCAGARVLERKIGEACCRMLPIQ
jgi:hypothetical protein